VTQLHGGQLERSLVRRKKGGKKKPSKPAWVVATTSPANLAAAMAATPSPCRALLVLALAVTSLAQLAAGDTNGVYEPCSDAWIQRGDGFTFGIVFAGYNAFFSGNTQLSPCDRRLNLASSGQLAVFRPKVDEISLLTINTTTGFNPVSDPVLLAWFKFLNSRLE